MGQPSNKENVSPVPFSNGVHYPRLPSLSPPSRSRSLLFSTPARRPAGGNGHSSTYEPNTSRRRSRRQSLHTLTQTPPRPAHSQKISRIFASASRSKAGITGVPLRPRNARQPAVTPSPPPQLSKPVECHRPALQNYHQPCAHSTSPADYLSDENAECDNDEDSLQGLERAVALALSSPDGTSKKQAAATRRRAFHLPCPLASTPSSSKSSPSLKSVRKKDEGEETSIGSWTGDEDFLHSRPKRTGKGC